MAYICNITTDKKGGKRFEAIAQNLEGPVAEAPMRGWMGQYELWQMMQADSSVILDSFAHMAAGSRYDQLTQVEAALAMEDYTTARALLGDTTFHPISDTDTVTGAMVIDNSDGDDIVNNYITFYNLYLAYHDTTLTGSDSSMLEALADMCPIRDGNVVYQARALRNMVFDSLYHYDDSCSRDTIYPKPWHGENNSFIGSVSQLVNENGQTYSLSPNPSNGNITIQQLVKDAEPVQVEVMNVLGQSLYKERTQFSEQKKHLKLAIIPGSYLLRIVDTQGRAFMLKFTVQ